MNTIVLNILQFREHDRGTDFCLLGVKFGGRCCSFDHFDRFFKIILKIDLLGSWDKGTTCLGDAETHINV